jgi:hypothetical protein
VSNPEDNFDAPADDVSEGLSGPLSARSAGAEPGAWCHLLLRVGMQPLLFLFVFTFVMPRMSGGKPDGMGAGPAFGTVLLPGLMAVAIMFSGIAAVALPLSTEFGITREIDDRVMCPCRCGLWRSRRSAFRRLQSMVAALLVIPMAIWIPATPVYPHIQNWFLFVLVLVMASLLAGALGLAIGSSVSPGTSGWFFPSLWCRLPFWDASITRGPAWKKFLVADCCALQSHRIYQ